VTEHRLVVWLVVGWLIARFCDRGEDDEVIQFQMQQASQGNEAAMIAMGSLLYYGARGMQRNQAEAYRWFRQAADLGNPQGQSACADMLIKGEGVEANATEAVRLYKQAAEKDNIRALNGERAVVSRLFPPDMVLMTVWANRAWIRML
jgi:hypothetical protein